MVIRWQPYFIHFMQKLSFLQGPFHVFLYSRLQSNRKNLPWTLSCIARLYTRDYRWCFCTFLSWLPYFWSDSCASWDMFTHAFSFQSRGLSRHRVSYSAQNAFSYAFWNSKALSFDCRSVEICFCGFRICFLFRWLHYEFFLSLYTRSLSHLWIYQENRSATALNFSGS